MIQALAPEQGMWTSTDSAPLCTVGWVKSDAGGETTGCNAGPVAMATERLYVCVPERGPVPLRLQ